MKENKFIKQYLDNNNIEVIDGKFFNKKTRVIKKTTEYLDDRQFIKVFISANAVLSNLKNSSKLVFEYVFKGLQSSSGYNKTEIEVNYKHYSRFCRYNTIKPLCEKSFYLARKQLIELDVIDETDEKGLYYFNLNYFFNGNRLTVITEYVKTHNNVVDITNNKLQELEPAILDEWQQVLKESKQGYRKSAFQS